MRFRAFGFQGPRSGARHAFMMKGALKIRIPNPHGYDIPVDLLRRILRQAEIAPEEWSSRS